MNNKLNPYGEKLINHNGEKVVNYQLKNNDFNRHLNFENNILKDKFVSNNECNN